MKHQHHGKKPLAVLLTLALAISLALPAFAAVPAAGQRWDYEADVVVIGAGGAGLPAALKAVEDGATVLVVETNWDCGGHAATSEGQLHSGGKTVSQQKWNVEDSADLYFYDQTRPQGEAAKFNDKAYARSVSNAIAEAYKFIVDNGVVVQEDKEPLVRSYWRDGGPDTDSVGRLTYVDATMWENFLTGTSAAGIGITRPLEKALRDKGVRFLMNYHMDKIFREGFFEGKVVGVEASYTPHIMPGQTEPLTGYFSDGNINCTKEKVNIKANKAVVIATGGSTGNLNFRTMFNPALGPEYDGLAGMPFSDQDASGEIAALEVGAAMGAVGNYTTDIWSICSPRRFGTRFGYGGGFNEKSKVWPLVVAPGIQPQYDSLCIVNMLGSRFGNEDEYGAPQLISTRYPFLRNASSSVVIDPDGDGNAEVYGGPIWAIFDQAACDRNDWVMEQGVVDFDNGYCFKADTLEELAEKLVNKYYEHVKMDPKTLVDTITRYNGFVDAKKDEDWGKTSLGYKIENGPFYAAWATPSLHDTLAGLRVDASMQVMDIYGNLIPNLFAAGESSGGMAVHGLGRVITSGYIAGRSAASVNAEGYATADNALKAEFAGDETNYKTKTDKASCYSLLNGNFAGVPHSKKMQEWQEIIARGPQEPTAEATPLPSNNDLWAANNVFLGSSDKGMGGTIQVKITVEGGKMTKIEVVKHNETPEIGPEAMEKLIPMALEKQSNEIDVVASATITSEAFMEALGRAMEKAGLKK